MNKEQEEPAEKITPESVEENWKDKYLFTLAEMENMRKRMQKERYEMSKFGIESAIAEFLPAIDNYENALRLASNSSLEVKNWAIGFEMILAQFKEVLQSHGIYTFHSEGMFFDPIQHEAVEMLETQEHANGLILQEFTKGYKSSTRTIRPARVKVAKNTPREETTNNTENLN